MTSPCIFHFRKMIGDIFRTPPISHTPGTAAPPGSVLSHALPSQSCIASEGLLWRRDTHTPCCGAKVLKHTVRPRGGSQSRHCTHVCTGRKRVSLLGTVPAQHLPQLPRASPARHPHRQALCLQVGLNYRELKPSYSK